MYELMYNSHEVEMAYHRSFHKTADAGHAFELVESSIVRLAIFLDQ